jgi:hypothetical protein
MKGTEMSTVTEHTQMAHPQTQHGHPQAPPAEGDRRARRAQRRPRVLTHPQDVMTLVDLTKQLAQAYTVQAQAIQALQGRVKALETPAGPIEKAVVEKAV